jgi:hypothetical protein
MKSLISLMLVIFAFAATGWAGDESVSDVIDAQLAALNHSDFQTAYEYASPSVKAQIGTSANFAIMVESYYSMMLDTGKVLHADQRTLNGAVLQTVRITDSSGQIFWLVYEMVSVESSWKINGVVRIKAPGSMA